MLTSLSVTSPEKGLERRWFSDDYFDLIVWREPSGDLHGFQLCYDKPYEEHALTWTCKQGFRHSGIDSGESDPYANRTPILVPDGKFPTERVRHEFLARAGELPTEISELVLTRLSEYEKLPAPKPRIKRNPE